MKFNKAAQSIFALFFIGAMLSSCANVPINEDAKKVVLVKNALQNCKFLGEVKAYDRNGVTHSYASHPHLYQDGINVLKNKAAERGGNRLFIDFHKYNLKNDKDSELIDEHLLKGDVYLCNN